jgi:hypothetical protein
VTNTALKPLPPILIFSIKRDVVALTMRADPGAAALPGASSQGDSGDPLRDVALNFLVECEFLLRRYGSNVRFRSLEFCKFHRCCLSFATIAQKLLYASHYCEYYINTNIIIACIHS